MKPTNSVSAEAVFRETIRRAKFDPDWFCTKFLNSPNDPWQSEMLNAIADLDRIRAGLPTRFNHTGLQRFTIRAFHGPGKTHFLAKLMHWFNFTRRGREIATAPKEDQLKTRLWPEFRKLRNGAAAEYQGLMRVDKTSITWLGNPDWCAIAETAANPDNLQGHHDDWLLFVVEEASGVNEDLFPAIEGALSTPTAVLVMIGNPTKTVGEFYNSHMRPGTMGLYYRKAIKHTETTRISQKWVKGMIAKYGEDSPVVQVRVYGNFVEMAERQLLALSWLVDAVGKPWKPDGSIPRLRVSVDVSDGGIDSSVICVALVFDTLRVFVKQVLRNYPAGQAAALVAAKAMKVYDQYLTKFRETWPDMDGDLVVDGLGVGAGTVANIYDAGYPVVRYIGGEASDNPKMYRNRRTQSYLCYRDDLRDGKVVFLADYFGPEDEEDFYAQHGSIRTADTGERLEELETKKAMAARGVKSPDMADAPAMQYATQSPMLGRITDADFAVIPDEAGLLNDNGNW